MRRRNLHIGFWIALAVAFAGALLTQPGIVGGLIHGSAWIETLRPLLIALTLCALASATALAYGGAPDRGTAWSAPVGPSRIERHALWAVATLSLVFLALPLR